MSKKNQRETLKNAPKNSMTTFSPTFHLTPQPLHIGSQNIVSIFCSLYRSNLNGAKKQKKKFIKKHIRSEV